MRTAHQQRIEEFMRKAGQEIPAKPIMPSVISGEGKGPEALEERRNPPTLGRFYFLPVRTAPVPAAIAIAR